MSNSVGTNAVPGVGLATAHPSAWPSVVVATTTFNLGFEPKFVMGKVRRSSCNCSLRQALRPLELPTPPSEPSGLVPSQPTFDFRLSGAPALALSSRPANESPPQPGPRTCYVPAAVQVPQPAVPQRVLQAGIQATPSLAKRQGTPYHPGAKRAAARAAPSAAANHEHLSLADLTQEQRSIAL